MVEGHSETNSAPTLVLDLKTCIHEALLNNRELQIERLNPKIARLTLESAWGAYDPVFLADARKESSADSGGFDPIDFSRDAIYSADSDVARLGLTGLLPFGTSYTLSGNIAHSYGLRNGFNFDSYNLFTGISVRQPLLRNFWTDQTRTTLRINRRNLRITELGVVYLAMDVIRRVEQAYVELMFALENLGFREELLATRERFLAGTRRKIERGTLTVLDEKLAQAQVSAVQTELAVARNIVSLAENQLKTLLGYWNADRAGAQLRPTDSLIVVPELLDRVESWRHGVAHRPDLAQLREDLEKSRLDVRFRRNQLFPSLDLVAGYGRRGASTEQVLPPFRATASRSAAFGQLGDGVAPNEMIGIIFSVPLGRKMERSNYRAAQELRTQAELRVQQSKELVLREIADAFQAAQSSFKRVTLTRETRDLTEAALEAEEQKLAGGKSTIFLVLELQSSFTASQAEHLRAKADYKQALAQLRFAEGSTLERHQIGVDLD